MVPRPPAPASSSEGINVSTRLSILSAGAAESLVKRLRKDATDLDIEVVASFGAVGAMKEALLAGATCDLFITSARVMEQLIASKQLNAASVSDVGWVRTGLAVRLSDPVPDVTTPTAVADVLRTAPELFFPDPVRSTAGIHFSKVLEQIGLDHAAGASLHTFPNGATAMRALADRGQAGALGCTQETEILQTEGIALAGPLPQPYNLATRYQCALVRSADERHAAEQIFELLTGAQTAPLREELGT